MRLLSLAWVLLAGVWLYVLGVGLPGAPPPMRLLDLHAGLWGHRPHILGDSEIQGLSAPVTVAWDKSGVPHFFASTEADLYRAQGFVMASQRLFQMDLITRQAAGRLSEWVGEKAIFFDRYFVRIGMRESAEKTLKDFMADEPTRVMLQSFADGVNAYIAQLKQLPVEYILLGKTPEAFDPLRIIYMDKSLTYNLSGRSFALNLSRIQQKLGSEKVLDLFPEFLPDKYEDFILPDNPKAPLRKPETPGDFAFVTQLKDVPAFPLANPSNGSNNWAVGPQKSTTGHSILANDTHLGYSLPNIWYENQLSCPDFNVYGVALVAIPGIINGLNGKIAWGPTNGTTPVLDWFEIEFEDATSLRYLYKGRWLDPEVRDEVIVRSDGPAETVKVMHTQLGVVMHREGKLGLVANWMGHRSRAELKAIRGLYQARDFKECQASFNNWSVPIQNFICADASAVAIRHTGSVPKRKIGEGRFIMDGREAEDTLAETLPEPLQAANVPYVLSANQKIVGPRFPFYLGWDFEEPFRGIGIRRRLTAQQKLSAEDMMKIQNDEYDVQAAYILPLLLKNVREDSLSEGQKKAVAGLKSWIFDVRADLTEPSLFYAWLLAVKREIFGSTYETAKPFYPKGMRLAYLLQNVTDNPGHPDSRWINGELSDVVTRAFESAWQQMAADFGGDSAGWTWARYNKTELRHVARLPGFGSDILPANGSGTSIRGNHGIHGPVYKAVFELGDQPRAWMQVPGGNNGDPLAPDFERFVKDWSEGRMREVEYYPTLDEAKRKAERLTVLRPRG